MTTAGHQHIRSYLDPHGRSYAGTNELHRDLSDYDSAFGVHLADEQVSA